MFVPSTTGSVNAFSNMITGQCLLFVGLLRAHTHSTCCSICAVHTVGCDARLFGWFQLNVLLAPVSAENACHSQVIIWFTPLDCLSAGSRLQCPATESLPQCCDALGHAASGRLQLPMVCGLCDPHFIRPPLCATSSLHYP